MTISWNETKWAAANGELGLKREEICPGLTLDKHAESLAMFDCRNVDTNNDVWSLLIPIIARKIKIGLMRPVNGYEESDAF